MQPRPLSAVGADVLDRLDPRPGEHVLDVGGGAARTVVALAGQVGARYVTVVAGDAARHAAVAAEAPDGVVLDAQSLDAFVLAQPFDAALSVGVLHLVADPAAVLARTAGALRPGGRLVLTCAGAGNVADARRAIDATLAEPRWTTALPGDVDPWRAEPSAEAMRSALVAAGLVDVEVQQHEAVVRPADPHAHLRATVLGAHLARVPTVGHGELVDAVLARMDEPDVLRHVRLDATARLPEDARPPGLTSGETRDALRRRIGGVS